MPGGTGGGTVVWRCTRPRPNQRIGGSFGSTGPTRFHPLPLRCGSDSDTNPWPVILYGESVLCRGDGGSVTFGRYVEGLLFVALAFVPIGAASFAWRARLVPAWTGAVARLAEIVIGLATVTCVSELLGATHLFRAAAMVPVLAGLGTVGWYYGRRGVQNSVAAEHEMPRVPAPSNYQPRMKLGALVAVSVVAADWGSRTVDAFHHGMTSADTLWYHLPFAARFIQQGTIVPLHYIDSEPVTVFFPANSELIHALGMMFMGNDVSSPLVNLGWGAVALLAGWCIGRPYGIAPVSLTGVAILLVTPGLVATQPGGAYDDVVGLALILSCSALLITAVSVGGQSRLAGQGVAALAAGLALGTKFTLIAPVGALTIGVWVLARRGKRLTEGGLWLLLVALPGGFWYVRNLTAVGNPLPSLNIKLGPLALPGPVIGTPTPTVAHFLFNGSAWRHYFLPGLRLSFGPAWWALLALAGAGLILGAVAGPGRMPRMLAWVGLATAAAFLISPQYLAILGAPVNFVYNVRYADPAVVLGLGLLPIIPVLRRDWRPSLVLTVYVGVLAVTQLDGSIWPFDLFAQRFADPIGGADSLVGLTFGIVVLGLGLLLVHIRQARPEWRPTALAAIPVSIALLVSGFALQQGYLRNRYTNVNTPSYVTWAQHLSNARIAVAGDYTQIQYEMYGRDLTNYVQYVGRSEPHGGYAPITSCRNWRQVLNAGHYGYVLASTGLVSRRAQVFDTSSSYTKWTSTDPASALIRRDVLAIPGVPGYPGNTEYVGFSLFRLHGQLDLGACSTSGPRPVVPT